MLTEYNRELRNSKKKTWRNFCEGIQEMPEAARLQKALRREHSNELGLLKKDDGTYTDNSRDTLELLLTSLVLCRWLTLVLQ